MMPFVAVHHDEGYVQQWLWKLNILDADYRYNDDDSDDDNDDDNDDGYDRNKSYMRDGFC